MLQGLWRWFDTQQATRAQRGLLEFRDEEPRLVIAPNGSYGIEWVRSERSNELMEEAMLAANRAAAAHLTLRGAGLLFRHAPLAVRARHCRPRSAHAAWPAALLAATPSALRPQLEYRIRQAMTPAVYD